MRDVLVALYEVGYNVAVASKMVRVMIGDYADSLKKYANEGVTPPAELVNRFDALNEIEEVLDKALDCLAEALKELKEEVG